MKVAERTEGDFIGEMGLVTADTGGMLRRKQSGGSGGGVGEGDLLTNRILFALLCVLVKKRDSRVVILSSPLPTQQVPFLFHLQFVILIPHMPTQ